MERVQKELKKRTEQLVKMHLNYRNLMKAINCRVLPVAGYKMNVCMLTKGELDELDKIVKTALRNEGFHGRQARLASDERLYTNREDGGRGLRSFKEIYKEMKVRVACYMATATNECLEAAWKNEYMKEQTSIKRVAE